MEKNKWVQAEACPAGILQAFTVQAAAFMPFWLKYVGELLSADGKEVVVIEEWVVSDICLHDFKNALLHNFHSVTKL